MDLNKVLILNDVWSNFFFKDLITRRNIWYFDSFANIFVVRHYLIYLSYGTYARKRFSLLIQS